MSSEWKKRRRRAESVAEEAWDHLVSALDNARSFGGTVKDRAYDFKDRAGDLAGEASDRYSSASDRVSSVSTEAWKRANLALDALSGRRSRTPWGWIAVAALGGVAVGWAVAASAPKAIQAASERFSDEPDELPASAEPPAPYEPVVPPVTP
ncbi:hypothetical protein ABT369_43250 [Dactylosporangium sp. NPDC000244]|uniref:hypothetical protein n=1 Tax=Dactylosporangium sp. NPDC000244 TaxID=3154365 RepID=UPI00332A27C4